MSYVLYIKIPQWRRGERNSHTTHKSFFFFSPQNITFGDQEKKSRIRKKVFPESLRNGVYLFNPFLPAEQSSARTESLRSPWGGGKENNFVMIAVNKGWDVAPPAGRHYVDMGNSLHVKKGVEERSFAFSHHLWRTLHQQKQHTSNYLVSNSTKKRNHK